MTFYDDAELAAIAVVREALTEVGEPSGARGALSPNARGILWRSMSSMAIRV